MPQKAWRRYGNIRFDPQYMSPCRGQKSPQPAWHCWCSNWGGPPERIAWPCIGNLQYCRLPEAHNRPARYWWGTKGPHSPTKAWSEAEGLGRTPSRRHNLYWPSEVIAVEAEFTAFDDRPTRQTARPQHANTQGEEDTRQEIVTDVGNTDGLDNEDACSGGRRNQPSGWRH